MNRIGRRTIHMHAADHSTVSAAADVDHPNYVSRVTVLVRPMG
jgi:hypothetical protein